MNKIIVKDFYNLKKKIKDKTLYQRIRNKRQSSYRYHINFTLMTVQEEHSIFHGKIDWKTSKLNGC